MLRKVLKIYWSAPGGRPLIVASLMLLAGVADLLSMGALVPLVSQITSDAGQSNSVIAIYILSALRGLGIEPDFSNLLILVGVGLTVKSLIALSSLSFVGVSVADVTTRIRSQMLNAIVRANWAYFVNHKPGEVASQISAQSTQAGQAYYRAAGFVTTAISGVGLFAAAALISPKLMVFTILAIIVLIVPLSAILKFAERSSQVQWRASNDLTTGIEDVVNNMKPLKSMGRQRRFVDTFNSNIRDLRNSLIMQVISGHATFYGQDILAVLMVLIGVWFGVQVLHTPVSQFFVFGVVFYQMIDVIKRVQQGLQDAVNASVGYVGVMETIRRGEAHAETDHGTKPARFQYDMRFEDVTFSYAQKNILSHVYAKIDANSITVLVGPSGSGKTTFLDLIIGFNQPKKGKIIVDGVDLRDIRLQEWRHQIGYVPQELTLLRGSVADNITLGDETISAIEIENALRLAGAYDFVTALPEGINTDIGTMGAKLSGGQRQRISLARALVHKPKLLLLDEVTSALDDKTEDEICRNIQALTGELTIIAITHRPAWKKIADRIYHISQGKAVEEKIHHSGSGDKAESDSRSAGFRL